MKRRFSAKPALTVMTAVLMITAASCSSTSFTEKAVREAEALPVAERPAFYEKTLKKDTSLPIFYNLIFSLLENGEYEEAKGWLSIALANHPSAMRLWNAKLWIARETEDAGYALSTLEKAVEKWPGDETYASFWLEALRLTGDPRAREEAEKALLRFPENKEAIEIMRDFSSYWAKKRKVTREDFLTLDLPYQYIWNTIEDAVIRTWRSLPE